MTKRWIALIAATVVLAVAAGCGGSSGGGGAGGGGGNGGGGSSTKVVESIGKGEGALNLIAWQGYTEPDVVKPFEKSTGCQVHVTYGQTSDEMVQLMRSGNYDGVSASGDATNRLIAAGDVVPVDVQKLIPDWKDISPALQSPPHNTVGGLHYGVSYEWGADVLMYNTKDVKPAPTSWGVMFDGSSYKGKVDAYDSPIYIADAAVYLKAHQPDLKITNPYELDDKQFKASVDLLKAQRQNIGEYWSDYTKEQAAFTSGDSTVGTTWQVIANLLDADKVKVRTTLPKEGATGWSDTWMIAAKAKHPNCMYKWMNWIISPKVNAEVAEWFGEAPSNAKSCAETADKNFCKTYHADDQAYFSKVSYWTTPRTQCGDARGSVCKDYAAWVQAWTEIKG